MADDETQQPKQVRGPLAPFLGFAVLVVVLAGAFVLVSRSEPADRTLVEQMLDVEDVPLTVVADPPSETQAPFTITTLVAPAATLALSVPGFQAAQQLLTAVEAAGLEALEATAVRSTLTSVDTSGSPNPYITLGLLTDEGYFDVVGLTPDGNALWYTPAVLQLATDLTPGATWTSEGLTLDFAPFTFTGEVLGPARVEEEVAGFDGRAGCLDVRSELVQEIPGAEGYTTERRSTWCPGLGSIVSENLIDGVITRLALPSEANWPALLAPPVPQTRPAGTQLAFPVAVTAITRQPLSTASGLVVVNSTLGDLALVTVGEPSEAGLADSSTLRWMQHPGGTVVGTALDDDADIYVTTSLQVLRAFDDAGRMRWSVDLPDIASGAPVTVGDVVVVALVDGTMRGFDRATGAARWVVRLSDVIAVSPVRAGDVVVAADTSGYVVAVDERGRERWSASVDPVDSPLSGFDDGSVLLAQTSGALALYDASGDERWSVAPPDSDVLSPAAKWAGVVAVPTSGGLLGLSAETGEVLWSLPELVRARVTPIGLATAPGKVYRVGEDGTASVIAEITEVDGSEPTSLYLAQLGAEWVAVTQQGAMTFLGVSDG